MNLSQLETPCVVLDKGKLEKNIEEMRTHLAPLGVKLRPHGKTSKCIDVVRLALEGQLGGITVSTLKEAEYFFEQGIVDILYAVGIAPVKLERVATLINKGADITITLDTLEQAEATAQKAQELGVTIPVLIEIDCDGHRAGIKVDDPLLIEIGSLLHQSPQAELRGVMTHAGGSYNCKNRDEIRLCAAGERDAVVRCAEILGQNGLPCPVVSVGSTPTMRFAENLSGVTEARPGVYMFYDLVMAGLDVCGVEDIAVSVLASVIGYQKQKNQILTDAGWMALSRDRGTANQRIDQGYGLVCDIQGNPLPDLIVTATNQEHGIVTVRQGEGDLEFERFPVGSAVRILPNHACATCAMHDRYYVVSGTTEVVDIWQRLNGW